MNIINSIHHLASDMPWTPQLIGDGDLITWFDARSGITKSGNNVTQWNDLSNYNNNATQANTSNSAIYFATGLNNLPTLIFTNYGTGTTFGQYMTCTGVSSTTEFTIVSVLSVKRLIGNTNLSMQPINGIYASGAMTQQISNLTGQLGTTVYGQGGSTGSGTALYMSNNVPFIYISTCQFDANNYILSNTYKNYDGPYLQKSVGNTITSLLMSSILIGSSDYTFQGPRTINGNVSSVITYNKVLSSTERLQLTDYLVDRWNITI